MTQHKFIPSPKNNPCSQCDLFGETCTNCTILIDTCSDCGGRQNIVDHVFNQACDRCAQTKDCTYFPKLNKKVCLTCAGIILRETDVKAKEKQDLDKITNHGDLFNAKIMSFQEMEKLVKEDNSIPENEKGKVYQELIANRIVSMKEKIFNLDKSKHDAYI